MVIAMERKDWLTRSVDLVLAWIELSRQRTQLAGIDVSFLKDVGISPADADAECRKHFWQR
jgi:uncharacterized protein YjiS (DUF1127 family)